MLDSSPNLQGLKLIGEWFRKRDRPPYKRWSQPRYVPECLVNRLETLVWKNYKGEIEDERQVAQYILRNASRLETATFSKTDIHPKQRLERLKELESVVWASNSCQLVFK
ncbi:FBD / Leucine Rich Repeat domains containing protein [Raphanus sativus]|nr:FBD / Leucine Rich Repeat domains containing protein [Raphanus sativus]